MQVRNKESYIDLKWAMVLILAVIISVLYTGYYVGNRYFWNQYDTTTRLERELRQQQKEIEKDSGNPEKLLQLGWNYYQQGDKDEALNYYQKVLQLDPKHVGGLFNSGLVYFDQGNYVLAEEQFEKIRKMYPKHLENLMALGELYIAMNNPDQAIDVLETLMKIKKSWTQAHYLLGQAYEMRGLEEKAEGSYKEALRYDPNFIPAKDKLAEIGGRSDGRQHN